MLWLRHLKTSQSISEKYSRLVYLLLIKYYSFTPEHKTVRLGILNITGLYNSLSILIISATVQMLVT